MITKKFSPRLEGREGEESKSQEMGTGEAGNVDLGAWHCWSICERTAAGAACLEAELLYIRSALEKAMPVLPRRGNESLGLLGQRGVHCGVAIGEVIASLESSTSRLM